VFLKIVNFIYLYWTNLKRNFLREIILGLGVILATLVLIIATTFGDGIEKLHKQSILGRIPVNEIKIAGKVTHSPKVIYNIKPELVTLIEKMPEVERVTPISKANFPVTLLVTFNPPQIISMFSGTTKRTFFLEVPVVGIPDFLAKPYFDDQSVKKDFPDGFKKTGMLIPILIPSYVKVVIDNFIQTNDLPLADPMQFKKYLDLRLVMNHSLILSKSPNDINNKPMIDGKLIGFTDVSITSGIAIPIEVLEEVKKQVLPVDQRIGWESAIIHVKKKDFIQPVIDKLSPYFAKYNIELDKSALSFRNLSGYIVDAIKSFKITVLTLSGFIILLSGLAIFYSFLYLVIRRSQEIGLYRFFGATKVQVTLLIVLEAVFIGLLCAMIGFFMSYYLLTYYLPDNFNGLIDLLPKSIVSFIFSSGGDIATQLDFKKIFEFNIRKNLFLSAISALSCVIAAFIPAIIGSSKSLSRAVQRD